MTIIASSTIEAISFYRDTTDFVNYLKANESYSGVGVSGHSLGGGLAIITGAQAGVPAVALSGPNAMLTRSSLNPPITSEDLDSKTFVSWRFSVAYEWLCFSFRLLVLDH